MTDYLTYGSVAERKKFDRRFSRDQARLKRRMSRKAEDAERRAADFEAMRQAGVLGEVPVTKYVYATPAVAHAGPVPVNPTPSPKPTRVCAKCGGRLTLLNTDVHPRCSWSR